MKTLRVLYDISGLGLGQVSTHARGGSHRVDRQLAELLRASPECELLFCANHSSLAYEGCLEYLRTEPRLADVPLLRHGDHWVARGLRQAMASAHRRLKVLRGGRALPPVLRSGGALVDARVHRPILDATPPADVYHSSTIPLPARAPRGRSPRRFMTIYDLRASHGAASDAEIEYERALVESVTDGDCVITSSESTRRELCDMGVAEADRVFVVPLAADRATFHRYAGARLAEVRSRYGIPRRPYILMLNDQSPRKNLSRAIEAFARVAQQEGLHDLILVLAGRRQPVDPAAAVVARWPAMRDRIVSTGYVSDDELGPLYGGAVVFVYPSLYEGFGLPPLEAMQCGAPVITANTSSLPEVVGDAGVMVDPRDTDVLASAILGLCGDSRRREAVCARSIARAAEFCWERTAAATLAAYRAATTGV
jgi:glycosyltransferase involved in cell wall biosynthesis